MNVRRHGPPPYLAYHMAHSSKPSILLTGDAQRAPAALLEALREAFPEFRLLQAATEEALRAALAAQKPALALCDLTHVALPVEAVARLARELQPACRILAVAAPDASTDIAWVMSRGARDLVSLKDPLALKLVVARELEILPAWCERNPALLRTRAELEPVALMQGEELEWCSEAFVRLLDRNLPTQVARRALWACIDGNDHHVLQRALLACVAGKAPAPVRVGAVAPDGRRLLVEFSLLPEKSGGRTLVRLRGTRLQIPAGAAGTRAAAGSGQLNVDVLKRLRAAVASNGLALALQPISGLAAPVPAGAAKLDVLIRIKDAAGELTAADFMTEAGAAGMLKMLDHWVIRNVTALYARTSSQRDALFFLRISRQTLQDPTTPVLVRDTLAQAKMKPAQLSFELPEAEFAALQKEESTALLALKKLGCMLTLSQFGMREESPKLLHRMPLDYIKLDTRLTEGAAADEDMRKHLRTIVELATTRHVSTISTRVADATTLATLWKLGVHLVQGYYVHEPEIVVGQ